jgi:hypothetical protein
MIHRLQNQVQRTRWILAVGTGLLASALGALAADKVFDPVTMSLSFNSRGYVNYGMFRECISYMRIEGPGKTRPLYLAGWGRRGDLSMTFEKPSGGTVFFVRNTGAGFVEYKDYPSVRQGSAAAEYTCSSWVSAQTPIHLKVTGFKSWEEEGERMDAFLAIRQLPKANPNQPVQLPQPVFKVKADMTLLVGDRTIPMTDQAGTIRMTLTQGHKRTTPIPMWRVMFEVRCKIKGADLGLTGPDAGDLNVTFVAGAVAKVPDLESRSELKKEVEKVEKQALEETPDVLKELNFE